MEIERRFLVKEVPAKLLSEARRQELVSAYIERKDGYKLRARKIGHKFFITEKKGSGLVREEKEKEISESEFSELSSNALELIKKTRYRVLYGNLVLEIDEYEDSIKYPTTVEVEFKSEEQATAFVPPPWFGAELLSN